LKHLAIIQVKLEQLVENGPRFYNISTLINVNNSCISQPLTLINT